MMAHRLSWELNVGPIPEGMCVLHKCDVPNCVRPEHLFIGTRADNTLDMVAKGRHWRPKGEKNSRAILSELDVLEIRKSAHGAVVLARQYGVSETTIYRIRTGERWAHI